MFDNEASNRDNDAVLDRADALAAEEERLDQVYVVVKYTIERIYGGPEEGGWWFTEGTFDKVVTAHTYEYQAVRAVSSLNASALDDTTYRIQPLPWLDTDPRGESCHSDHEATPKLRTDIQRVFPEHRPHYC